ncbi:LuxR C-terminal-related transcriptional regulator, partial [Brachybacterium squillarum]
TDAGHEVVAAVGEATPLLHAVTEHSPDLAVIDVRMPPSFTDEGVRAATLIRAQDPDVALLVLSQYVEERYASELIADSPRGLGYVLKDRVADVEDFLGVVDEVGRGGTWLDPEVVQQIFVRSRRRRVLEQLTPREREVLSLMAQGRSNQAIADALFVSAGSVEKHISSLLTKLDLPPVDGENRRVMAVLRYLESEDRS